MPTAKAGSDLCERDCACQAERLLAFLRAYSAEYLYLIGDIIDFWAMKREVHSTPEQNTVVQKVLRRARHGEQMIFIPGNHDEALREYTGIGFGDIRLERAWLHTTATGKRYALLHGDEFDQVTRYHRWIAMLGGTLYSVLVRANGWLSWARRHLGITSYWSLAGYARRRSRPKCTLSTISKNRSCVVRANARSMGSSAAISTQRDQGDRWHRLCELRRLDRQLHGNRRAP